jgi:hypothetical protein
MPSLPSRHWEDVEGEVGLVIDWRAAFRGSFLTFIEGGEMRGFHVIFRIQVHADGEFEFWDDDGCIVRRAGSIVHEDRASHPLVKHAIAVRRGDILEFAQWQDRGAWLWKGRLVTREPVDRAAALEPFLGRVAARLRVPDGPPLKMFTNARHPVRAALAIYSMVLRGYAPAAIRIYGEHQWTETARAIMRRLLPFAVIVPTNEALAEIERAAGSRMRRDAGAFWWVLKACVPLFCEPRACCMLDDDVVVLDSVADALQAFERRELVYARDDDYVADYSKAFGHRGPLPTGDFNAGLYWVRTPGNVKSLIKLARRAPAGKTPFHIWEQGYIAVAFADRPTFALPTQRYLYPRYDGLPGDVFGYDYAANPCGFASVHFGGVPNKPTDAVACLLAPSILSAAAARSAAAYD